MSKLLNSNVNWIQWVKEIKSNIPGPNVTISACTHWGEKAWEKSIDYMLEQLEIDKYLLKWKINFILTNIEGYLKSFDVQTPVEARFIDEDLNRACSIENMQKSTTYEVMRALELQPILEQTDVHLDIHSTYTKTESMLILTKEWWEKLKGSFNCDVIYTWITDNQVWKPFIDITERSGGLWVWIECGYEEDPEIYKIWVENSILLLDSMWMVDKNHFEQELLEKKVNKNINTYATVLKTEETFQPIKNFNHNEFVTKGTPIARIWNKIIRAPKDSIILMPNPGVKIGYEYCFLAEVN